MTEMQKIGFPAQNGELSAGDGEAHHPRTHVHWFPRGGTLFILLSFLIVSGSVLVGDRLGGKLLNSKGLNKEPVLIAHRVVSSGAEKDQLAEQGIEGAGPGSGTTSSSLPEEEILTVPPIVKVKTDLDPLRFITHPPKADESRKERKQRGETSATKEDEESETGKAEAGEDESAGKDSGAKDSSSKESEAQGERGRAYFLQLSLFIDRKNADQFAREMGAKGYPVQVQRITKDGGQYFRVQMGYYGTKQQAEEAAVELQRKGYNVFLLSDKSH
ncbi:MAG: SPOR domain-containing protein [Armatimonadetes bacterium]|nr:SPOR domain-containing protein [Armatimonadota bacterium]